MFKKFLPLTTALYLAMAGTAHAMPAIVGGIGAIMSTQIAAGVTLGSIALGVASMGAQWLISKMLTPEPKQRGIKTRMSTGGDNPPTFIVGEYATPGQLVYINEKDGGTNIPQSLLVMVVQLSCMPIDSVSSEVFISNERCTINAGTTFPGGFYAVDEYVKGTGDGGYCSMKFYLGGQTAADSWLMSNFGSDPDRPWKNTMFLPGCAYAVIRCWYSNRGIWAGMPTFRFVVRGAPLYDPRKDSTVGGSGSQRRNNPNTWTYSKNAKVIEYNTHIGFWYGGDHVWGGRAEPYRLPLDYWFAAMNACDENITKKNGDVIKRYVVGAEISLDDKPIEFITEINKSCDGYTTEYGGTYKTWCGTPGLPVGTITDDDWLITADMETNRFQGREQTFNTCYPTYPEPKQMWEVKEAPRYVNSAALAEDGEELPLDLPLPLVTESNQVQRLAKSAVKDSRRQVTHSGVLLPMAYIYEPFDVLNFASEDFGYGSGKRFFFAFGDDLPDVNQQVLIREVNSDDQGYVPADEQDFEAAPLVIIRPGELVLDLAVFADQVDTVSGKDRPAIRAEWTWGGPDIDVDYVDWRLRRVGSAKVVDRGKITRVEDNQAVFTSPVLRFGKSYEVQFRPKPFAIRESAWTAWKTVTCVIVDVPLPPSLTRVSKLGTDGKLSFFLDVAWTLVSQEGSYVVRAVVDGTTTISPATSTPLRIPAIAGSTIVVSVAAVGADGTIGDWSSATSITVTKKNTAPTAPISLTATGKIGRIDYLTNKNPDSDFDHFNLYGSNTNDFTTAVLIDDSRSIRLQQGDLGNAVTRYAWITAVDSSGNESAKFPASNTAGRVATTTRVAGADIDDGAITDAKTDQTAPGTPIAPTLATYAGDIDGDGTIDTGLTVSITAPSGVRVVEYELQKYASATLGGSYVAKGERIAIPAEDPNTPGTVTAFEFKANQSKFWKARVRAIAFNGKKGAWSTPTTAGVQPSGYSASLSATPPTVSQVANGYVYSWVKPSDKAYKETEILVNGVALTRVNGAAYPDNTIRTVGASPTVTVRHFDKSGNFGATSAGTTAPAYRAATAVEVGVLASSNLGPAVVQSSNIEAAAVLPSKTYRGAVNNVVRDFDMFERGLLTFMHFTKAAGSGTKTAVAEPNISRIVNDVTGLTYIVGTSLYKWQAVAASLTDVIEIETENLISVVGGREYMIEGAIRNVNRFTGVGATFDSMTLTVQWWRVDASGNLVRHSADSQQITSPSSANNVFEFPVVAPSQAMFASLIWTSIPANANGQLPTIQVGGPVIRELPRYLESSWAGIFAGTNTSWSSGRRALAIADLRTGTAQFPIKREPRLAIFHGRFRNAAATGMSYEVQLCEYDVPSGVTSSFVIDSIPLYRMSTDDVGSVTLFDDGTAQGYFADAYALVLSANQSGNDIRAAKLIADLRFS